MSSYIIILSNEGDLLQEVSKDVYRATFDRDKAKKFETHQDAIDYINENEVRFMWRETQVGMF